MGEKMEEISIFQICSHEDMERFWREHAIYMERDILPNVTLGGKLSEEEKKWLFSENYKKGYEEMMKRHIDKVYSIFFMLDGERIGFCSYCTYLSEDYKCFIIDFCIYPKYRYKGYGKKCFEVFKQYEKERGAEYFELNVSNEQNRHFWETVGFEYNGADEFGSILYQYKPEQMGEFVVDKYMFTDFDQLLDLMGGYKYEIGEDVLNEDEKETLKTAIREREIQFFVVRRGSRVVGMCSVAIIFSTFKCKRSGIFDDLYIMPVYRSMDLYDRLVKRAQMWAEKQGALSLITGSSEEKAEIYEKLGFDKNIGYMLAWCEC